VSWNSLNIAFYSCLQARFTKASTLQPPYLPFIGYGHAYVWDWRQPINQRHTDPRREYALRGWNLRIKFSSLEMSNTSSNQATSLTLVPTVRLPEDIVFKAWSGSLTFYQALLSDLAQHSHTLSLAMLELIDYLHI
jgi:hypothetical protein